MDPPQVAPLSVEQRELRALSKQVTSLAHFLTRETCEKGIQCLLPMVQEAIAASEVVAPEGLDDKQGMDLIEAILERRSGTTTPSTKKRSASKGKKAVVVAAAGAPASTVVTPVGKDKRKSAGGAKAKSGRDAKPKQSGKDHPPRKQRKVVAQGANSDDADADDNNNDNNNDNDAEKEEHQIWNCATHGSIVRVIRYGRRSDSDPTFGLFIYARANGQGQKKPHTFFANRDSLAAVDNIHDKYKHKRVITALSSELCDLSKGKDVEPELERLLQGSTWGKRVLAEIANVEEEESSSDSSSNSDDSDGGHDDVDK